MAEMKRRCKALAEDDVIPRGRIKGLAVTSGIESIFRASAMDWSRNRSYIKIVDLSIQISVGVDQADDGRR